MRNAILNKEMLKVLKSIVGKKLNSIELATDEELEGFGNIALNVNDKKIEISNIEDLNGIDREYETSHFAIRYIDEYKPILHEKIKVIDIKEIVTNINIITDNIIIPKNNDDFYYDMCIEIITENHKYSFARSIYFSMDIGIHKDKNYDEIYSIEKAAEGYQIDDYDIEIKINRVVKTIDDRIKEIS